MEDEEALARKLAFVRPERRALVERRIAVLERYLARKWGDDYDAKQAAADLGMSRPGFYRLLRAWVETRDPVKSGVTRAHGPRGPQQKPGDDFIARVLAGLPKGRPLQRDVRDIERAARDARIEIRSTSALTRMVRQMRQIAPHPGILIDHAALALPCQDSSGIGPVMPVATILADGAARTVHAVHLRLGAVAPDSIAQVLNHARRLDAFVPAAGRTEIAIDANRAPGWARLFDAMRALGVDRVGDDRAVLHGGRLAKSLAFPTLLGIAAHPKLVHLDPGARGFRPASRNDDILSFDRAQALVDEMVATARAGTRLAIAPAIDALIDGLPAEIGD
jgi:hypothetical protein